MMFRTSSTAVSPSASMPSSFGICLMEMSSARPKTKPRSTDSEKNWAMRPSFSTPAPMEISPARMASAAVRAMYSALPSVASSEIVAADMMAMAEDTATTS